MTAREAIIAQLDQMERNVSDLQRLLAAYLPNEPRELHWGHVGDLHYVNERLREAVEHFIPRR